MTLLERSLSSRALYAKLVPGGTGVSFVEAARVAHVRAVEAYERAEAELARTRARHDGERVAYRIAVREAVRAGRSSPAPPDRDRQDAEVEVATEDVVSAAVTLAHVAEVLVRELSRRTVQRALSAAADAVLEAMEPRERMSRGQHHPTVVGAGRVGLLREVNEQGPIGRFREAAVAAAPAGVVAAVSAGALEALAGIDWPQRPEPAAPVEPREFDRVTTVPRAEAVRMGLVDGQVTA